MTISINRCNLAFITYHDIDCYTTRYGIKCTAHTNSTIGHKSIDDAIEYWNDHNDKMENDKMENDKLKRKIKLNQIWKNTLNELENN